MKRIPEIVHRLFPKIQWISTTEKPLFTFDDGPNRIWTPQFSELIKKHNLSGVFFLVGNRVNDIDILQKIISDGHEIAWHSQNHNSFWKMSEKEISYEINSYKNLEDKIQRKIRYFRFPYGRFFPKHIKMVLDANLKIMMWSFMCHDYKTKTLIKLKRDLNKIQRNDIVLYHDHSQNSENAYLALSNYFDEKNKN